MTAGRDLDALLRRVRLVVFDFDGVFTDNTVYVSQDGVESVRCWRGDGLGIATLTQAGVDTVIVSKETNPVVSARSRKLAMRCVQGCDDKLSAVRALAAELGVTLEDVAFVGNDINDLACLEAVGLPIVVQDAHHDVLGAAVYRTTACGGRGAVREVCDAIVSARNAVLKEPRYATGD
ncbi:MAG: HAD hydrolase family protein [Acidobacteriia bacterium]|nr:HAD hydrolase family protein [Terriglobia bacterium]